MSRAKNRRGFTLIELLIVVVITGILALASVPVISASTQDARRSEGELILGTVRDVARIEYARTGTSPKKLSDCGVKAKDRTGNYFKVQNAIANSNIQDARIRAVSISGDDGRGDLHFTWNSGASEFRWR
ncbi:MAG: prepilin-type N-terminal cleavage/methylation domain-containing protein [Planctomycetes bacterium]|nr:prepilin-type N-terminal cleavage/methylation domain-containing protein [Planctomycetota bacterium]